MNHLAAIALGANLPSPAGSPAQTVSAALAELSAAGRVLAQSSLYITEPVGRADQPPFINAAALLETTLEPEPLLRFLLDLERRYARRRDLDPPKGPRTLDLDLLLYDDRILNTLSLTLPHPSLAERRFVLAPLCQIAPQLRHPASGTTIADLLAALPATGANGPDAVRIFDPGQTTGQPAPSPERPRG